MFIQMILSGKTSLPLSLPAISSTKLGALLHLTIHAHLTLSDAKEVRRVTKPLPVTVDRIDDVLVLLPHEPLRALVEHATMITIDPGDEVAIIHTGGIQVGMRNHASKLL